MDRFDKSNDLASLLDDNTTIKRESKISNRRGDFLSTLQRSKTQITPDNKNTFNTTSSEEMNRDEIMNEKRAIEVETNIDTFENHLELRKNSTVSNAMNTGENRTYSNSAINFNSEINSEQRRERSTTEKIIDKSKINEQLNLNNLLGRRRSQLISSKEFSNNLSQEKEKDRSSDETLKVLEAKPESKNISQKQTDDDLITDSFVPTLTKNSRRTRGSIFRPIEEKESKDNSFRKEDSFDTIREKQGSLGDKKDYQINQAQISSQSVINKLNIDKIQLNERVNQQSSEKSQDINIRGGIRFNENPMNYYKYQNSNGEINLSFRGDGDNNINIKESTGNFELPNTKSPSNKQEIQNLQDVNFKLNADKDYLQTQLNILKQRIEEDRLRHERQSEEERQNFKRKENEYKNFIEELKRRHKDELISTEERNKSVINSLNEEIRRIRNEIVVEVQNEKEKLNILHQNDLESRDNILKKNFEIQKRILEDQIENLKKQLERQIEMNKIANKVENSSRQIEDILQKFYLEKEISLENERNHIATKEKFLSEKEEKLKENENSLKIEKEKITQIQKEFEFRELEKRKEIQEEKMRIEKEVTKLHELQNSLKSIEFNSKEKYEREKFEFIQKQSEMKKEHDELKRDFNQRLKELENEKKIFEEEKKFFDKYKDEALKNVEVKKLSIEERKNKFYEEEKEIKARIKILQEKEYFLKEKFEEFEIFRREIHEEQTKLENDRAELILTARRIEEGINTFEENKGQFEIEKGEYLRKFQECESERVLMQKEKIKLEQAKAELKLRMQSVDLMRMQYISGNLSSDTQLGIGINVNSELKTASMLNFNTASKFNEQTLKFTKNNLTSNSNANNLKMNEFNFNQTKSSFYKSFNSDEYLQSIKLKMKMNENSLNNYSDKYSGGNIDYNNFFQKEKEYLKKSNEDFIKNFGKDYEKISPLTNFSATNLNNSQLSYKLSKDSESNRNKEGGKYHSYLKNLENNKNNVDLNNKDDNKTNNDKYLACNNDNRKDDTKNSFKQSHISDESIKLDNNQNYKIEKPAAYKETPKLVDRNVLNDINYDMQNINRIHSFGEKGKIRNEIENFNDDEIVDLDDF